jgi:hypothetical protein
MGGGVLQALAKGTAATQSFEAVIQGQSMGAALPHGSRVQVDPPHHPLKVGEIVLHKAVHGLIVAHRVVRVSRTLWRSEFVLTQGDAQLLCDMPLRYSEIVGVAKSRWDESSSSWKELTETAPHYRLVSRLAVAIVSLWGSVAGASQRHWLARNLLWLRRS